MWCPGAVECAGRGGPAETALALTVMVAGDVLHYLPASLVVVEVHEGAAGRRPLTSLPHVHEGLGEGHAVGDVVRAS